MAEIGWTEEAERWLRDIFDYIALDDTDAAANKGGALGDGGNMELTARGE